MVDINDKSIEIAVSKDGKVLWANADGKCVLRVNGLVKLDIQEALGKVDDPLEAIQFLYYHRLTPETRQSFLQELQKGQTKVRITEYEIRWSNG